MTDLHSHSQRGSAIVADLTTHIPTPILEEIETGLESGDSPEWLQLRENPADQFDSIEEYVSYRSTRASSENRPVAVMFRISDDAPDALYDAKETYKNQMTDGEETETATRIERAPVLVTAYVTCEENIHSPAVEMKYRSPSL